MRVLWELRCWEPGRERKMDLRKQKDLEIH